MPPSKRPKKAYRPKTVLRPLTLRSGQSCEMPLHAALCSLGTADFGISQLSEFIVHGEIVRDAGQALHHPQAVEAGQKILEVTTTVLRRLERTEKLGFSGDEITTLRDYCAATTQWVRTVPNTVIHRIVTTNRKQRGLK